MKTNKEKMELLARQHEIAKKLYFEKYPNNGKTVKAYWEKCRVIAAKEVGLIK